MDTERQDNPIAVAGVYVLCAVFWGLIAGVCLGYYSIVIRLVVDTWDYDHSPPSWAQDGFWAYGQQAVYPRFVVGFFAGAVLSVFFTRRGLKRRD